VADEDARDLVGKQRMDSLPRKVSRPVRDHPEAVDDVLGVAANSCRTWCRTFCREPILDLPSSRSRSPAPDDGADQVPDRHRAPLRPCHNSADRDQLQLAGCGRRWQARPGSGRLSDAG